MMTISPKTTDGSVKVIALIGWTSGNLNLHTGANDVCLMFAADNAKVAYLTANGGVTYNDANTWHSLRDVERIIGTQKWETVDDVTLAYAHAATTSDNGTKMIIKAATISADAIKSLYRLDGKQVTLNARRGYATASLKSAVEFWRNENYI